MFDGTKKSNVDLAFSLMSRVYGRGGGAGAGGGEEKEGKDGFGNKEAESAGVWYNSIIEHTPADRANYSCGGGTTINMRR